MRQQETSVDVEEELRVAVKARQELGIDHEDEVIESFLARMQDTIDARVEAKVDEELRSLPTRPRFASPSNGRIKVVIGYTCCQPRTVDSDSRRIGRNRRGCNCRQPRVGGLYALAPGR